MTLRAVDDIRAGGGTVLAMSARDLPQSVPELGARFGGSLVEVFAAAPSAPIHVLVLDGAEIVQEGRGDMLVAAVNGATQVGMTTVLVARDDAQDALRDMLRHTGHDTPWSSLSSRSMPMRSPLWRRPSRH